MINDHWIDMVIFFFLSIFVCYLLIKLEDRLATLCLCFNSSHFIQSNQTCFIKKKKFEYAIQFWKLSSVVKPNLYIIRTGVPRRYLHIWHTDTHTRVGIIIIYKYNYNNTFSAMFKLDKWRVELYLMNTL